MYKKLQNNKNMTTKSCTNLIKLISQYSKKIRQKLVEYGYSRKEIDLFMSQLLEEELRSCQVKDERLQNIKLPNKNHTTDSIQASQGKQEPKPDNNRIYNELLKIVGKLEVYLKEIEQSEKDEKKQFQITLDQSMKEKSTQGSQQQFTAKSIESNSSFYRIQAYSKISNENSTESDSFETQEIRLKTSLRNMIKKTRLLKAMIENSVFMTSLREMEGLGENLDIPYVPYGGYIS